MLRPRIAALLLLIASAAMLGGAYAFQYLGGLAPCVLCLYQRKPHMAVIGLALVAALLARVRAAWLLLIALAVIALWIGAAVAGFHVGVEQQWWPGTPECGVPDAGSATSASDMLAQLMATPVVRCDQVAWSLFGISMAGYNFLLSLALGLFGLWALVRRAGTRR